MDLNQENIKKIRGLIVFTVVILIGVYRYEVVLDLVSFASGVFAPLVVGCAIAFILSVPMAQFEQKLFAPILGKMKEREQKQLGRLVPAFSLLLSILLVIVILALVIGVVFPEVVSTVYTLANTLPEQITNFLAKIKINTAEYPEFTTYLANMDISWDSILKNVTTILQTGATAFLNSSIGIITGVISGFATFFIGFAFACYILLQKGRLYRQCKKVLYAYLPEKRAERVLYISDLSYGIFANFLTGQCLEAVILGLMFFVSMTIFGLPYALLIGVLIAFTALIPIFGAFIGCIVGSFLILTVNPMQALIFLVWFLVLQQLEGNLIYPRVVGGSVGLPSIWVLAAVTVGGGLFGIVGMLVFIPLVSVLYTLLREQVAIRLAEKKIANP